MEKRAFGKTGLMVTPLGFGASEMGDEKIPFEQTDKILNGVLDAGINLIDTSACYGNSELKIAKAVAHRRDEFVLTSKCGHKVDGLDAPDWSPQIIGDSIARSLKRLETDRIDMVFLHSCEADRLANDEMIASLARCKRDGMVRFIGYSGDGAPAKKAVEMGVFDCIETSVNICEQQVLDLYLPAARDAGLGVIAKRPLGNTCWKYRDDPASGPQYPRPYAQRLAAMGFTPADVGFDGDWLDLMLRFTAYQDGVHCTITGSTNLDHMLANIKVAEAGPLDDAVVATIRAAWATHADDTWIGQP